MTQGGNAKVWHDGKLTEKKSAGDGDNIYVMTQLAMDFRQRKKSSMALQLKVLVDKRLGLADKGEH